MNVREMKTSVLFRRLAHRDRLGLTDDEGIADEIDSRFPVLVEPVSNAYKLPFVQQEAAKARPELPASQRTTGSCVHGVSPARCTQCAQPAPRYDDVFAQGTAMLDADARAESTGKTIAEVVVTYCATCHQILDYPAQRCSCFAPAAPRAESTGKQCVECGVYVEKARECYAQPTCYECLPPPEPLLIAPAPAAPTDEWTTILELGPGDIFETPSGNRGAKNENGSVLWFWKVGSYEGPYQPVRKLHVLNPGEIAVRVDEATVERVAKQVFAHGIPFERSSIVAREILELLRAESKGSGGK